MVVRVRAGELARRGGISVQQVRNYVDQGLLPPAARTESGYRAFTTDHAEALDAVRALAEGHGWAATRAIMRAANAGDVGAALAALDESHAALHRERSDIARVMGALAALVAGDVAPARRHPLRVGEVAAAVRVRPSALRVWERRGLLRPGREAGTRYRVYDEAEQRMAEVVALLRRGGYPMAIVRAVVDELRTTGNPGRVREQLAKRDLDLTARSRRGLAGSAALHAYLATRGR